jgi:hypothetical protein
MNSVQLVKNNAIWYDSRHMHAYKTIIKPMNVFKGQNCSMRKHSLLQITQTTILSKPQQLKHNSYWLTKSTYEIW